MVTVSNPILAEQTRRLEIGETGLVAGFNQRLLASKLLSMGVLPGSRVTFVRRSPFGGAVYLSVDGQKLALRQDEFAAIVIRK